MPKSPEPSPCLGCGAVLPAVDGPTHRYLESSPACWAAFGEVLAREYADRGLFSRVHRLTVDAYAVQHPGHPSEQTIQSVAVHLISLCVVLENGASLEHAADKIRSAVAAKGRYHWLKPPPSMGPVTVVHVLGAVGAEAHERMVAEWARAAWTSWAAHHATVRRWCSCR